MGGVRGGGFEPPRCYPLAPQASASTSSAILATARLAIEDGFAAVNNGSLHESRLPIPATAAASGFRKPLPAVNDGPTLPAGCGYRKPGAGAVAVAGNRVQIRPRRACEYAAYWPIGRRRSAPPPRARRAPPALRIFRRPAGARCRRAWRRTTATVAP